MNSDRINAAIITIGDELLIGQVIDTNSAWIAQELNKAGVWIKRRVSVGDVRDEIWNALDEESKHANLILITGGLGPTADDITKPLLCEYFGGKLVVNNEALENVRNIFQHFPETAIHTVPTGFCSVPPSGPIMPLTATAKSVFINSFAPCAICHTVSSLTAPTLSMVSSSTRSTFSFTVLS